MIVGRRTALWMAMVIACAAPLAFAVWPVLTPSGRAGMVAGVAIWMAAIVSMDLRMQHQTSRRLMIGTAILTAIELIGLATPSKLLLPILYTPAFWVTAFLEFIMDSGSEFAPPLVLTLVCGAQALGLAYVLGAASVFFPAAITRRIASAS